MKNRSHFQSGSGVYTCKSCNKRTRETGEGESDLGLCKKCYVEAGFENEHSDTGGDHNGEGSMPQWCPTCREEAEDMAFKPCVTPATDAARAIEKEFGTAEKAYAYVQRLVTSVRTVEERAYYAGVLRVWDARWEDM